MIDIRELRIGNYVQYHDTYMRMESLMYCDEWKIRLAPTRLKTVSINEVTPIILTNDLLIKCGFYKVGALLGTEIEVGIYHVSMKGYCLSLLDELGLMFCRCSGNDYAEYDDIIPICPVGYLHELQNLCFDLTRRELEVNL